MKRYFLLAIATTISILSQAATYYCSPTGNGNGNLYNTPCSFSDGVNKISQGGDTLYLLDGVYYLGNTQINKSGSASKNIVISGYPGEKAIMDFRSTSYGTRGLQIKSSSSYLHIKDLTLRYSGKNNLYNEGSNCRFENLDIYGSADTGCQMKNGGGNLILNVDSHDNFDYEHYGSEGADFGGNADGFADKQHSGKSNTYRGCRAWNNSDDGWDFFDRKNESDATPTIIENCICYINGPAEYNMKDHARYQTDKKWFDDINGATITNRYGEEQVVTLEHYPNHGNGNGFKLGGNYSVHNVIVHHCLSVANTVKGFDQNNNAGTMRIYNNTGYKNGNNMGFHNATVGTLYIQNNVSFQTRGADMVNCKTIVMNDHNTWNNLNATASDFVSVDTTEILRVREADGSLAEGTLLHLADGSRLRDAGIDVGYTYNGAAPDLGCYESEGAEHPWLILSEGPAEQTIMAGDTIEHVVIGWGGCDTKPRTKGMPEGITRKVSNTAKTLTFSGAIHEAGTYTITTTTACEEDNTTMSFTIHVRPASCKRVAYVTLLNSEEDQLILEGINKNAEFFVKQTDATDSDIDYSQYALIILGAKPSSSAAGFGPLKGYNKPMLLLKPFLLKESVWNWGTAINTSDLSVDIQDNTHPIFTGIHMEDGRLNLFTECNQNAVTALSAWKNINPMPKTLATPTSNNNYTTIAEIVAGSDCNGTKIDQKMLMIGLSEYSTSYLTSEALHLIENSMYYLLDMPIPTDIEQVTTNRMNGIEKRITPQGLVLIHQGKVYSVIGQRIQ